MFLSQKYVQRVDSAERRIKETDHRCNKLRDENKALLRAYHHALESLDAYQEKLADIHHQHQRSVSILGAREEKEGTGQELEEPKRMDRRKKGGEVKTWKDTQRN